MKSQSLLSLMVRYFLLLGLIVGFLLVRTVGWVHAQTGSELPILDHVQGEVLVDVWDHQQPTRLKYPNIPLEEYVKNTLPGEWYASTDDEDALKAGAVAIRTYALHRVHLQTKLLDGQVGQNYQPNSEHPRTNAATAATDGRYMAMAYNVCVDEDAPIDARHQQETGNPTDDWTEQGWPEYPYLVGVEDEHTQQATQYPGMCQLGSDWYATENGWGYLTILGHYYSGFVYRLIGGYAGGCIEGDVENCNCVVNLFDLVAIGGRYNMTNQDPGWDPHYDIAKQGKASTCVINLLDLVMVAGHYDETCQF